MNTAPGSGITAACVVVLAVVASCAVSNIARVVAYPESARVQSFEYPEALPLDGAEELRDEYTVSVPEETEVGNTNPDEDDQADVIHEDDPRWDCRTMGNRQCGTEIEGTWYVVQFDVNGDPVGVWAR